MNIALMSHDAKKELMVQFCIAYCGIFAGHDLCATNTTGRYISEATGLPITLYMGGSAGGCQQISARIAYNEIDLVIFLRDPKEKNTKDIDDVARMCDERSIPFASNIATAEVLVQGLRRGDLDWRDIVNPKKK